MEPVATYTKDPDATLDYVLDWSTWLGSDTITSAAYTVPDGLTKASESNTTTTATVWLSGGTDGASHFVTCRVVTAGGRTDDRSILIRVGDR
jgi:hypothetical protein